MVDKFSNSDSFKDHIINLCKVADMCAAKGDYLSWYNTLAILYRNTVGFLGKNQNAARFTYDKLKLEHNILKQKMASSYPNPCKVQKEFLDLINDFDLSIRATLINSGILTGKSESNKIEFTTETEIPMGFNDE